MALLIHFVPSTALSGSPTNITTSFFNRLQNLNQARNAASPYYQQWSEISGRDYAARTSPNPSQQAP
jgi:hypothetical protein